LDACPETPKGPIEVIVEKFGAAKIHQDSGSDPNSRPSPIPITEKWVTVAPKKRGRSLTFSRRKNNPNMVPAPASPSVKIISSSALDGSECLPSGGPGITHAGTSIMTDPAACGPPMVIVDTVEGNAAPVEPVLGAAAQSGSSQPAVSGPRAVDRLPPSSPHFCHSSPASPLSGSAQEDEDVDMFLNLELEEEEQLSPESTKKRKFEVGEASSPSQSSK